MMRKILLLTVTVVSVHAAQAQQAKKSITGYALTAADKGGRGWKEVRMVDINSGTELKTIFSSKSATQPLNARTGKPVVKKEVTEEKAMTSTVAIPEVTIKKVVNLDKVIEQNINQRQVTRVIIRRSPINPDQPFASTSAAMGYDKKHDRLYYTPMFVNQLRYIDLKSGSLYYFENEAFGTAGTDNRAANHITRMAFASDGNGYALTNDANQLIRFTTGKKPVITNLGSIADDAKEERFSIHNNVMYGGDMIADASGNLYLITANRFVFKINIENKSAKYLGVIKGLPQGFTTNGAMVEEGSKVIIASSESTVGYYRFDLNTLQAEKVSESADVFNASDLANGNLAFDKKKKDEQPKEPVAEEKPIVTDNATAKGGVNDEGGVKSGISIYPNPVTNGVVRLSFAEQPAGRYQVQLLDLSGRMIGAKEINIGSPMQTEEFRFPELSVKGNYLIRVSNVQSRVNVVSKVVVQ